MITENYINEINVNNNKLTIQTNTNIFDNNNQIIIFKIGTNNRNKCIINLNDYKDLLEIRNTIDSVINKTLINKSL